MGGKPMKIPWTEVLAGSGDVSPASVDGVAIGHQEETNAITNLPDRKLKETIERMKSKISSITSRLPDKGAKFHTRLRELEEEQDRRKRSVRVENEEMLYEKGTKSKKAVTSGNSKEEENSWTPLRSAFSSLSSVANSQNRKSKSSGFDYKVVGSSSCTKLNSSEYNSSPISKRRRASKSCQQHELDWIKTESVVLLDDEDVLPAQHADSGEMKEVKIHYPTRDHPDFVEVSYNDIRCLEPKSYLSSTIMNFYIQYLQNPASIIGRPINEYHFFNTYFYHKLEKAVSCKVNKTASFSKLRRWLRGVNIFQKAYIFLPIHGDLHWSLVIICIPEKEDKSGPIILHLDSLGFHSSHAIFRNIEIYLKEEWEHVYKCTSSTDIPISKEIWDSLPQQIKKKKIMVPQQKNEYDCGLFVLYFMERFIEEAPERVKRKDLAKFGSKWFQPEEASGLRKNLRELLLHEFKKARPEDLKEKSPEKSTISQEDDIQQGKL